MNYCVEAFKSRFTAGTKINKEKKKWKFPKTWLMQQEKQIKLVKTKLKYFFKKINPSK